MSPRGRERSGKVTNPSALFYGWGNQGPEPCEDILAGAWGHQQEGMAVQAFVPRPFLLRCVVCSPAPDVSVCGAWKKLRQQVPVTSFPSARVMASLNPSAMRDRLLLPQ